MVVRDLTVVVKVVNAVIEKVVIDVKVVVEIIDVVMETGVTVVGGMVVVMVVGQDVTKVDSSANLPQRWDQVKVVQHLEISLNSKG